MVAYRGKRLLDLILTIPALVLLSPFLAMLGLLIRIKLGAPVLFCQHRPGLHGQLFTIYKFRTMTDERDEQNNPLPDAMRLTAFGRFLRSSSLDELPELFNVLRGEMSLVGPRPLMPQYLDRYSTEQAQRHNVRPGITGWTQINGRNTLSWEEKFKLDVWYVDNHSLLLDIRILLMTLWKVIKREGISAEDHSTMPEFLGASTKLSTREGTTDDTNNT